MSSLIMPTDIEPLTEGQRCRYARHIEDFNNGMKQALDGFYAAGRALWPIRYWQLYREEYATFEEFCRGKLGISDEQARRLLRAAETYDRLKEAPPIGGVLPTNEAQIRPLTRLPESKQAVVWQEAVASAPDGVITARHIEAVAMRTVPQAFTSPPGSKERIDIYNRPGPKTSIRVLEDALMDADPKKAAKAMTHADLPRCRGLIQEMRVWITEFERHLPDPEKG